jgi:hypothetical protein
MNEIIETIIRQQVPATADARLSFLKFNTAGSPTRSNPKVLFFCFVENEPQPRYCLKSVRASRDNAIIEIGFKNLQELSAIDADLFAKPLWVGEIDGIAYSIETALPGQRARSAESERIVSAYTAFQRSSADRSTRKDGRTCAQELLALLTVDEHERDAVQHILDGFSAFPEVMLLPQHGDLTQDNVLISRARVGIVDCDWYMQQGIAGFDLFHFLRRILSKADTARYLRTYREAIGLKREFTQADLFLWYMQELELKQRQGSPRPEKSFAESFERLCAEFPLA